MLGFLLAIGLGVAPAPSQEAPSSAPNVAHNRMRSLVVHADGVDVTSLTESLRLRLPGRSIEAYGESSLPPDDAVLAGVLQVGVVAEGLALSLILWDGRAYFRTISADPDQEARAVASVVANLIAAIEEDRVAPDREGVAMPALPATEPAGIETPLQRPVTEPPAAEVGRRVSMSPPTRAPASPEATHTSRSGLELGIAGAPAVGVGLGGSPAFRGLGARGRVALRLASGAMLAANVGGSSMSASGFRLHRVRTGLGAGYDLRRGNFDFPILLDVGVEPWWVGGEDPVTDDSTVPIPLLGLQIELAPSYWVAVSDGRVGLRVGLLAAFSASAELRRGVVVPVVRTADDERLFRLGGFEATVGLELGITIPVARRGR